ncbi:RNA recognition motif domain [Cinara cedri]|uniref:RNA recognition motif domain n=1 Tax=Cinara cedri TaxID=506608 RepID=A0A5E4NBC4_9HEMI|nr:RNA recognition motif domain [Cinara cedri]
MNVQSFFTSQPPTHPYGFWPQQAFPNSWQAQFYMPNPVPQTKITVTNSTASNGNLPTFRLANNSTIRSPSPGWRSFNTNSRQQIPFQYANAPRKNWVKFTQSANGNVFGNLPQNPQSPFSSSPQNWPQFNQRPRFIPRQHIRMNRPQNYFQNQSNGLIQESNANAVIEFKTQKRKLKSQQSAQKPLWNYEDAVKAIAAEIELRTPKKNKQIMIRFPDHEITKQIVQNFHSDIKSVHFHTSYNPRYCYVQVQPNANIENVAHELNETIFQHEKLCVEIKESEYKEKPAPESIDPYTLYLGNLSTSITSNAVKDEFPKATRVDIGFAKKIKFTRYAFIKFLNAEDAINAFKEKYNLVIDSRSVVLRFRRSKGNLNLPKLPNEKKEFDMQSLQKKIKYHVQENSEDYNINKINVSKVKLEFMEDSDNEQDVVYESHVPNTNDINIKSEYPDYDEEYENYNDDKDTLNETNHESDITIPPFSYNEDCQFNDESDDEDDMPYTFLRKNQIPSENNRDIILPSKITDVDDDNDRKWNDVSDDEDDMPYTFLRKNQIPSENNSDITLPSTMI